MKTFTHVITSGQSDTISGGFAIRAVRVDNFSNQWLQIAGQASFIRPYTFGEVDLLNGAGAIQIGPSAPPGTKQPKALTGEQTVITIYDEPLPPQPGIPGQIKIETFLANNAISYSLGSGGAGSGRDITPLGAIAQAITEMGGVRRIAIKALSTNAASIFIVAQNAVIVGGVNGIELPPGDGITIAYPWTTTPSSAGAASQPPSGQAWLQAWFNGAAPDTLRILILGAP